MQDWIRYLGPRLAVSALSILADIRPIRQRLARLSSRRHQSHRMQVSWMSRRLGLRYGRPCAVLARSSSPAVSAHLYELTDDQWDLDARD